MDSNEFRSLCPAASALDILGDRWSLLIVRDLLMGKRRFADFQESPEGISTNILASRLKRMVTHGMVEKHRYQTKPNRYEYFLTKKGADLIPILQQVCRWGLAHIPGAWQPPQSFLEMSVEEWWERNNPVLCETVADNKL